MNAGIDPGETTNRQQVLDRVYSWCQRNPRYYGMQLPAANLAFNMPSQLRFITAMARRKIVPRHGPPPGSLRTTEILVDGRLAGKHAILWFPVVRDLVAKGFRVTLAYESQELPPDVARHMGRDGRDAMTEVSMPFVQHGGALRARMPNLSELTFRRFDLTYRLAVYQIASGIANLTCAWRALLQESGVRIAISSAPFCPWGSSLFAACRDLGICTLFLQQGHVSVVQCPVATHAVVWTEVGRDAIHRGNFGGAKVIIARNPSIPCDQEIQALRSVRRLELGLGDSDSCILVLGQKSRDQVYEVPGYIEVCGIVGEALARAHMADEQLIPLLRPHYNELGGETERILRASGALPLRVSASSSLMADIAASDLVISMYSTALEEAWLAGRPIVQVIPSGYCSPIDYGLIGAPIVRNVESLAKILTERAAWRGITAPRPPRPTVVEVLAELVKTVPARVSNRIIL